MKKHLFTKFLALFLSGAMLTGAGCKNYDDDIDGINQRLDELVTGKIAPLEQQISTMQSAISNLQNADNLLGSRIDELKSDVTANASEITKLQTAQSTLRTDIDKIKANYVTSDQLSTTLSSYALTQDLAKTYVSLSSLGVFTNEKAIQDAIDAAKTAAVSAAGAACAGAFQSSFDGALAAAMSKDGAIGKALAAYDKKITDAISEAVTTKDGVINKAIAKAIADAVSGLQTQIDSLKSQVDALASQIQSLVYLPEFEDGQTDLVVYQINAAEVGNLVNIKLRVSPASAAANMKALFEAGKLALVVDQVKTRAIAPEATITGISTEGLAEGMFVVSATVANYPASDKIAVALTVKSNIYKEGDKELVNNDVVSNYGVIGKAAAQPLILALCDAEGKTISSPKAYTMPWNTSVVDSKIMLLGGYDLKASLDGGTTYESLEKVAGKIGAGAITNMAYTAAPTATVDAKLKLTNASLSWSDKLATIAFAKVLGSADKGVAATVKHKITCKINNVAFTVLNDFETSYTVSNQVGASMTFADQNLPWTYEFVKSGVAATNPTPAFTSNEIAISGTLNGITLGEIMAVNPVIEISPVDPSNVAVAFTNVASQVSKIAKITLSNYAWGKTYDVKATYTLNNTDYTLSGKITTGAAPEKIVYNYAAEDRAYGDFTKTGNWNDVFAAKVPAGFFKDKAQFAEALFAGSKTATVESKRFDTKTSQNGSVIASTNGTLMTATEAVLKGDIKKADVVAIGNRFVQKAAWTTWYGQDVEVSMTFDITLPSHNLVANPDRLTAGVGSAHGIVENNVWKVIDVDLSDFYSISPANASLSIVYAVKSTNGGGKIYPTLSGKKLIWTAGTTTESEVQVSAQLMLDGTITVGSPVLFKVVAEDPIKTFAAAAAPQAKPYVYDAAIDFNLLKGISLIDAAGKAWIKADDGTLILSGSNNAKTIFAMTSGTVATGGIKFGTPVVANGTFAGLSITDNKLNIPKNQAGLEQDVTITIPAEINYWLGGTKKISIQVKVTK